MIQALVRESGAMPAFFTLIGNLAVRPCDPVWMKARHIGVDKPVRLKKVRWRRSADAPLFAECEGRVYPF